MSGTVAIRVLLGEYFFTKELPLHVNRAIELYDLLQHSHDFLEICYVSEGAGMHYIGDESMRVYQGDIFFIPVGTSHVFRPASASAHPPLIVYNMLICPQAAVSLLRAFPGGSTLETAAVQSSWRRYRDRQGEFGKLLLQMHYEYAANRSGRDAALHAYAIQVFLYLQRAADQPDDSSLSAVSRMDDVLEMVHDRFSQALTVQEGAKLLGVGERQFHRLFTKHTGMGLSEYVQNVRIREACRLLRTTGRKVSDIAAAVGYQDLSFFNGLFKKKTGLPPGEYRRRSSGAEG